MTQKSQISSFDADLIFTKSNSVEKKSLRTLKYQHMKITQQVTTALTQTENGNCSTEADLEAVFGNRQHTANSEAYFWELTYHVLDHKEVIPIDSNGQAHLFPVAVDEKAIKISIPSTSVMLNDVEPDTDEVSSQQRQSAPSALPKLVTMSHMS